MKIAICLICILLLAGCTRSGTELQKQSQLSSETPPPVTSHAPSVTQMPTQAPTPTPAPTAVPTTQPTQAPQPTEEFLITAQTHIDDQTNNRMHNIQLCADKLNGYIVGPGDTFSFNEAVGARTPEKGYRKAPIIIEKKKEMGYGGGVCQVSSTLYQAARDAGFPIIERHEHGKPITYTEKGDDAAVSYNGYDLKFRNSSDKTLKIKTAVGDSMSVSLYLIS